MGVQQSRNRAAVVIDERYLPRDLRGGDFEYRAARAATLKNAVEALGTPHTEVGAAAVNGAAATLERIVRDGDDIVVQGWLDASMIQPAPSLAS
ncbi:MAG: hypothetical protein IT531_09265 [Burkholderiales bacterium]|nr:hypothetical protein [Burkholderiales bacterium]